MNDSSSQDFLLKILEKNSLTSTELTDALGKFGAIPRCQSLFDPLKTKRICGLIHPLFAANGSNLSLHKQLEEVLPDSICVVFTYNCADVAILGKLVCDYLFRHKKIRALVVHGFIRDTFEIARSEYPVWCFGSTPVGCSNKPAPDFPIERKKKLMLEYSKCLSICDSTGVVAVPRISQSNSSEYLDKFQFILHQENVWNFCINHLKWSTYKTIVTKSYLLEPESSFSGDALLSLRYLLKFSHND